VLNNLLKKLNFLFISTVLAGSTLSVISARAYAVTPTTQTGTTAQAQTKSKKTKAVTSKSPEKTYTITSIDVIGLKKIEKDAVIAKLFSKVGDTYSEQAVKKDIQNIFAMNYFVQIEAQKQITDQSVALTYKIIEKPVIAEILFEGQSEIKTEDLETQSGLKTYEVISFNKIQTAVEKLLKYYEDKGFYLAKIEPVIQDVQKDETVKVKFLITENDKVKVKKITFIGNKQLKDFQLKDRLFTKEAGFFSGVSNSGSFKQEAFDQDIQVLKYLYWNQGFLQVKIDRPLVTVTPDKKSIYITYHIEEGEQYSVGDVDFSGDLLFPKSELYEAIKIKDNGIFSVEVMRKDITDLQAKYGDLGYAFANVIPRYNFRDKDRKVDLIFEFEKGNKVYFGDITVTGNSKTRDKVVRRELKIEEGELYNETRKRQSQENIQRLGFFEEVSFKTSTPVDKQDQLNIEIVVKERNTGQIQLTAAYGNVQGFSLGGSVQQNNFRGLGQSLEARIDASKNRQDYKLALTDPYFMDTRWSSGFDIFYLENKERINYDIRKSGGNVRFGHPVWGDYTRAYLRYRLDKTDLFKNDNTDPYIFPLDTAQGVTSALQATIEYDTRNDRFSPSKGIFTDLSYERTGFGGDLRYQEFSTHFRFYYNLFWDVIWRNNLAYSNIQPIEIGGTVPFSETYQMGGPYTLRGFGSGGVGKRVFSQFRYTNLTNSSSVFYRPGISEADRQRLSYVNVGGTKQVLYQSEVQFPLIKEAGLSGVAFYDIGQAEDEIVSSKFLSDVGIGFRWMSPLGLLRFEWGWPLKTDDYNSDSVNFEFSIGPPF